MSLLDELKKVSIDKEAEVLAKSSFMNARDSVRTRIPALNIALGGALDGGLSAGLTFIAGPSKHFKSNIGLVLVRAYLDKYPDAVCVFLDTEFGITPEYIKAQKIDPSRVLHQKCENVESIKHNMAAFLKKLKEDNASRGKNDPQNRVIFFIDSIGNAASIKEVEDAEAQKSVADMSRAKALKSLFRIITPYLTTLNVPCVAVNHVYQEIGLFPKTIMGGGTGGIYSANTIIFVGRQQEKQGKDIVGYNFMLNIEKSRFVREKSVIPLNVTYDNGINPYSGLLDIAVDLGFVVKPSNGWYSRCVLNTETGEMVAEDKKWRASDTDSLEFWKSVLSDKGFQEAVKHKFQVAQELPEGIADVNLFEDS